MQCEQEGESKNVSVKAELHSLASCQRDADRIRLAMEKEELRSSMDKSFAAPVPCICETMWKRCDFHAYVGKFEKDVESKVEVLDKHYVKAHHQNEASFYEGLARQRGEVISQASVHPQGCTL